MATVHIGRLLGPVGFARTVAIKRLHPQFAKDPEFVAMFLDEARLAARIRHPNVVSTLDVVATEGQLFVVMEYVAGEALARLLRAVRTRKESVPIPIVAAIMVGVLHGLHAAHEAKDERGEPLRIVHRDVSPHNILVGTDGAAHLIDFGIAKARGRAQVTRAGEIKGKLSYMPPEQLLGQTLDPRADVFAASIVFWEALTGHRLFQGTDDGDICAKVLLGQVERPSLYARGLSRAADEIVLRGLARERNDRYATAREMALAIEAAIPLAPPSQVGSWVESLAGEALADRTRQIAMIEGGEFSGDAVSEPPPGGSASMRAASREETRLRFTKTRQESPFARMAVLGPVPPLASSGMLPPDDSLAAVAGAAPAARRGTIVAVTIAMLALAGVAVGLHPWDRSQPRAAAPASHVEAPAPAPRAVARPQAADWTPVPVPSAGGTGDVVIVDTTVPMTPPARSPGVERPAPRAPAPVTPAASFPVPAAAKPQDCDPPYWVDPTSGIKRYKRQCTGS
jgi:serine/threonine-protein kinase